MGTVVQFKKSDVSGKVPLTSDLVSGELAVNIADGKLFLKKADNTVVPVSDWVRTETLLESDSVDQVVDQFDITKVRSAKYIIQATRASSYHTTEVIVVLDGTNVYMTEYATIFTGSSLIDVSADISSSNVRLLVSPENTNTVVRTSRFDTLISIAPEVSSLPEDLMSGSGTIDLLDDNDSIDLNA